MNKDVLFEMIDEDLENIQLELDKMIDQNKHLGNVLSNCIYTSNIDFLKFDLINLISAYLSTKTENLSYGVINEIINDNILLTKIEGVSLLDKLKGMDFTFHELIKNHVFKYHDLSIIELKLLIDEFDDINIFDLFFDIGNIEFINKKYIKTKNELMLEINSSKLKKIAYEELDKEVNKEPNLAELANKYKKMINDVSVKYENENLKIKKIKTRINNYKKVKQTLNNLNLEKTIITEQWIDNILDLIYSKNARREFLCQIGTYQKTKFNELYKEYNKLSENNKLEIIEIFKTCDIDYNQLSKSNQENVLIMDKERLKEFLMLINKLTNKDYNIINYIISNSNLDVLKKINSMIKDGILTKEFVLNNINILSIKDDTSNNYFKLTDLIEFIKSESINPRLFITDQSIYLSDINVIKNNIKVLKQYNLLLSLKTTKNFDLLKEENLSNKIDMLLELSYEKELENNLGLLNNDVNKIKSLYILKEMDLLPTDMDSLTKVLENNSFIPQTDNVNDYIFNVVDYHIDKSFIESIKDIDLSYEPQSTRTILVGNVKLSNNRVLRNEELLKNTDLSEDDKILYSYVYGSILNEEEYNEIVTYVRGNVKIK